VVFTLAEVGIAFVRFDVDFTPPATGGETGLARLAGVVFTLFVADAAGFVCGGDTWTRLADLDASRSALIFSALLSGLSARLSYVTRRRLVAGSFCCTAESCVEAWAPLYDGVALGGAVMATADAGVSAGCGCGCG
jgi:hypothetical protein